MIHGYKRPILSGCTSLMGFGRFRNGFQVGIDNFISHPAMMRPFQRQLVRYSAVGLIRGANQKQSFEPGSKSARQGVAAFFDGSGDSQESLYKTGRAWEASELRLKGFDDLHKLWYMCWIEKNKLLTEKNIAKSIGGQMANPERMRKVRQSMARIKTVVNERRNLHRKHVATNELRELLRTELIKERKRAEIDVLVERAKEDESIDLEHLRQEYMKEEIEIEKLEAQNKREEKIKADLEQEARRKRANDMANRPTAPKLTKYRAISHRNKGKFTRPPPKPFYKPSEL